jgi:hypothetical protein
MTKAAPDFIETLAFVRISFLNDLHSKLSHLSRLVSSLKEPLEED